MISRINQPARSVAPTLSGLRNESDVEQKFLYPLLSHPSYLGLPHEWLRTKEYMEPTKIDKFAGKKRGYVPDYSAWLRGFPLLIVEAKDPSVTVETGLREAHLYAAEINKRYPPEINPIRFVLASNGPKTAISNWDSDTDVLIVPSDELSPGSAVLGAFLSLISKSQLEKTADEIAARFVGRSFARTMSFMGGQNALNQQLGVNEFAQPLFPFIAKFRQ